MLYSVFNLSLFRIIESVERTYKVTCDPAYAVKGYLAEMICEIGKISVNVYIKLGDQLSGVSLYSILNVSVDLFLIKCAVFYIYFYHNNLPFNLLYIKAVSTFRCSLYCTTTYCVCQEDWTQFFKN